MKSLFVLSLPRSMSSLIYHFSRQALGLREPTWTSDGEILNNDRHVLFTGDAYEAGLKFLRQQQAPWIFDQVMAFLDETVQREGFAYKDVVNPFVVADWPGLRDLAVLRIRRPLADVAWSVLEKQWLYPAYAWKRAAVPAPEERRDLILKGLVLAERRLAATTSRTVEYDDLISRQESLRDALQDLYPETKVPLVSYLDPTFRAIRDQVLRRRDTTQYQDLAGRLDELRDSMVQRARAA